MTTFTNAQREAAMSESMIRQREDLPDGLLVKLAGDIDFSKAPELRAELIEILQTPRARLVIDLADVGYMDSSGLATLVEALQIQRKRGQKMVLCQLNPKVRGIFEIARLDAIFTLADDVEKAKTV